MQFKELDWLSDRGIWAIIPCSDQYGKRAREFLGAFLFQFQSSFPRFWGLLIKQIIPLTLFGNEMNIAKSDLIYHLISNARSWSNF